MQEIFRSFFKQSPTTYHNPADSSQAALWLLRYCLFAVNSVFNSACCRKDIQIGVAVFQIFPARWLLASSSPDIERSLGKHPRIQQWQNSQRKLSLLSVPFYSCYARPLPLSFDGLGGDGRFFNIWVSLGATTNLVLQKLKITPPQGSPHICRNTRSKIANR